MGKKIAVFLDRDGTINEEVGFLGEEDRVKLLPGVGESIRKINLRGLLVVVVTNQSGVGRGYFTLEDLERVNRKVEELLAYKGAWIDAFYFCPHRPEEGCTCRKPQPGLYQKATQDLQIDLGSSYNVGDSIRDLEAGRKAGIPKNYLVLTGKGKQSLKELDKLPWREEIEVVKDLPEAVEKILSSLPEELK